MGIPIKALSPGTRQVRAGFDYDGGGVGKGGQVTLHVDGSRVGTGRMEGTKPDLFSLDETVDLAVENDTIISPSTPPIPAASTARFAGRSLASMKLP